jgi:UDP-N-acetylglucosamine 2-epimerase
VLYHSLCLVGNSSVGVRECSFLGVPVVNVGSRQGGRDRGGTVIDVCYGRTAIAAAVRQHLEGPRPPVGDPLYGDGRAGQRIAAQLAAVPLKIEKRLAY